MNEFEYYYDEQNNIIYISREILELSRKLNIEIEGKPKIINNKNCYSIHYKDLKKIEEQEKIKGIENKITNKEKEKNVIIVYHLANTDELYLTENINNLANTDELYLTENINNSNDTKEIMNKVCFKTTAKELEKTLNKKFVIVTVYQNNETATPKDNKLIVCNYNNVLFIEENILESLKLQTTNKKKIRVDKIIYIEITEAELNEVLEKTKSTIITKEIKPLKAN